MENQVLRVIGLRIRDLRKQMGISQEELGDRAGFHISYIGGVERAEKNITLLNLQKIANALNVSVNELFLYGKYSRVGNTDKDMLMNHINEKLVEMKTVELKKVHLLLTELFDE